jgi:hypothetical protein
VRSEEALAERVEGAGADVSVDNADGGDGEREQRGFGDLRGLNSGQNEPPDDLILEEHKRRPGAGSGAKKVIKN